MWKRLKLELKFMLVVGVILLISMGVILFFSIKMQKAQILEQVKSKAKLIVTQLHVDREWAANAVVEKNLDIEPSIMTIETAKLANRSGIYSVRLPSSDPLNPENAPRDDFEGVGLQALESGKTEYFRVEGNGVGKVFRWMAPDSATTEDCLHCHPGKKLGDVLGATSITLPMVEVEKAVKSNSLVLIGVAVGIILLIGGIIHLLVRLIIIKPLKKNVSLARAVASGDLTKEGLEVYSEDEAGELSTSLNTMNNNLRDMIGKIAQTADLLASATEELSASAEQMAHGSQESSSQTSQVATAVEQMSATVMEVAKNSSQAAESAKKTSETAAKGGEIVTLTIDGMNRIAEAVQKSSYTIQTLGANSNQIGEIIAVIDDIADQTNLLALNAAIEAARAGEQGRGFAVVADEVRKLAERTTKATKEIAAMIKSIQSDTSGAVASMESGTGEVERGVEMTRKAGEALKEIVNNVQHVSDTIGQIATAAEEQSAAAEQISTSIETIASVTKESAAGARQSSTACQELSRLALELQKMVGQFKLPEKREEKYEKRPSLFTSKAAEPKKWERVSKKQAA